MRNALPLSLAVVLLLVGHANAGVVNRNISGLGQPSIGTTDAPDNPDRKRIHLEVGETEFM